MADRPKVRRGRPVSTLTPADILAQRSRVNTVTGCLEWTGTKHRGYGRFMLGRKLYKAHRIAYELERGPVPADMNVCHRCDNPSCILPDHLFLGTHKDNCDDKVRKGRHLKGEDYGRSRITAAGALEIYQSAESRRILAERYGVSENAIRLIKKGRNWKHVTQQYEGSINR